MSNSYSKFTTSFPVMEHFYTIQGEGENTGKPAYFIRLAGCDVLVSHLAHGVPMGGGLEYTDELTLTHAMEGRQEM